MLFRHIEGTWRGKELTRSSSGNTRPQSSQLAEPLQTDLDLKGGIGVRVLISIKKKKKLQAGNELPSPQIFAREEKATLPSILLYLWMIQCRCVFQLLRVIQCPCVFQLLWVIQCRCVFLVVVGNLVSMCFLVVAGNLVLMQFKVNLYLCTSRQFSVYVVPGNLVLMQFKVIQC